MNSLLPVVLQGGHIVACTFTACTSWPSASGLSKLPLPVSTVTCTLLSVPSGHNAVSGLSKLPLPA